MRIPVVTLLSLALTGCALNDTASPTAQPGISIQGGVHGGQQPIVGAHIYLLAANTTGYGGNGIAASSSNASISLLSSATGHADSIGNYVLTGSDGSFTITGDYTCTAGQQVYIYSFGGNPGAGVNSAAGLMALLGNCPASGNFLTPAATPYIPFVSVNEITTVAAAYAFAGFATDATHISSSGTSLAQTGIANAFLNASNLADIGSGTALTTTPAGNGTVPQNEILTLANILASCINSSDTTSGNTSTVSANCATLFGYTLSGGTTGTAPADTASAAINIAHNPGVNVANLFTLTTSTSPYPVTGTYTQPNDFTMQLIFTGGGIGAGSYGSSGGPGALAIDAAGAVWVPASGGTMKLSSTGAILSPANGYAASGPIAIDASGNAWLAGQSSVPGYHEVAVELSNSGSILTGSNGYLDALNITSINGVAVSPSDKKIWLGTLPDHVLILSNTGAYTAPPISYNLAVPGTPAFDASGKAWIADTTNGGLWEISSAGTTISAYNNISGIPVIDHSNNVWVYASGNIVELSSTGVYLSPQAGYPTGGNVNGSFLPPLAVDGSNTIWVDSVFAFNSPPNTTSLGYNFSLVRLSSSGQILSGANGYGFSSYYSTYSRSFSSGNLSNPIAIAPDGSGNVWVANYGAVDFCCQVHGSLVEFIGVSTPVVTPLVANLLPPYSAPASKP